MTDLFLFSVPLLTLFATTLSWAAEAPPQSDLQGTVSRFELDARNYEWMTDGVSAATKEFKNKKKEIAALKKLLKGVDIEVFFGSWCGDSHDHLPTFLALMAALKPDGAKEVSLIALDRKKNYPGYTNTRNIQKLPTFVFFRGGREIGRIIETPTRSILEDTLAIAKAGALP